MVTAKTTKAAKTTKTTKKDSTPTTTTDTTVATEKGTNEKYEEIKKGDMHITALQK